MGDGEERDKNYSLFLKRAIRHAKQHARVYLRDDKVQQASILQQLYDNGEQPIGSFDRVAIRSLEEKGLIVVKEIGWSKVTIDLSKKVRDFMSSPRSV
jgi:hypothetical protein